MCRYAFKTYKPHFVCFECRKQFKRPPLTDVLAQQGRLEVLKKLQQAGGSATKRASVERSVGTTSEKLRREHRELVSRCPQCGAAMADLGLDFKPPRVSATRAWARIRTMYRLGHAWHTCGCNGPGFVPTDATGYAEYLASRARLFAARVRSAERRAEVDTATRAGEVRYWTELLAQVQNERKRPRR
jgi:hypothetical protein